MEKISKTFNVYKFNELSEEIQEEVFNKFYEEELNNYLEDCLQEDMEEEAKEILKQYFENATFKNIHYDFSYSQGSGALIEFEVQLEDINKKYKIFSSEEMKCLKEKTDTSIKVYQYDNLHFKISTDIYCDYEDIIEEYKITKKEFKKIDNKLVNLLEIASSPFVKDIISMNQELTRTGYEMIDGAISKEKLEEVIQEDYEFLENGEIFD